MILRMRSFNSKLVRLKAKALSSIALTSWFQFQTGAIKRNERSHPDGYGQNQFQFQTGAIKSNRLQALDGNTFCFNSKLVRLKVQSGVAETEVFVVSIPNWCD